MSDTGSDGRDVTECSGCWPGTSGPCRQGNNGVCWPYFPGTALCPVGTSSCFGGGVGSGGGVGGGSGGGVAGGSGGGGGSVPANGTTMHIFVGGVEYGIQLSGSAYSGGFVEGGTQACGGGADSGLALGGTTCLPVSVTLMFSGARRARRR